MLINLLKHTETAATVVTAAAVVTAATGAAATTPAIYTAVFAAEVRCVSMCGQSEFCFLRYAACSKKEIIGRHKNMPHTLCMHIRLEKQNCDHEDVIRNHEKTIQYLKRQL